MLQPLDSPLLLSVEEEGAMKKKRIADSSMDELLCGGEAKRGGSVSNSYKQRK
jgi:hypothetical protein